VSSIRVAVVGGPGPLGDALTEDVRGWSPALSFEGRAEAEAALADQVTSLTVLSFDVDALLWAEPVAVAEWHLDATVDDTMLVADDVLVESRGRPLALAGVTVARFRQGRVAVVRTYYDDASLIEQVIL
jgi:ketosteroid isomerase-like protein